uniref:Uncharacterized protein n=1 Tax=Chromera velia CCMP2878 TaxID=1169474 RepID=A0A0K6S7W0_9ALVE|eukprot:Cvel_5195.t2-p1 / transcript=Cvel_5195.t2 / gene=Cvel_5195 / organism=Chromera_velia_CCMP2878 / gene_product=hypothetical protein / transcript_product=hypothetical protein / location=Cvel_scaffold239:4945-5562(-) / protein_length=206 / sequence_SO=supercontig / SO=protein_coding / is_pseudo=false
MQVLNAVTEKMGEEKDEPETGAQWKEWSLPLQQKASRFRDEVSEFNFELVSATASLERGTEMFMKDVSDCQEALETVRWIFKDFDGDMSDYDMIRRIDSNEEGTKVKLAQAADTVSLALRRIIRNGEEEGKEDDETDQDSELPVHVWSRALRRMSRAAERMSSYAVGWFQSLSSLHVKPPGVVEKEDAFREALQELQKDFKVISPS